MKHCKTCQTFHRKEFERLCKICSSRAVLINYYPKISIWKSFISPFAVLLLPILGIHLIGLTIITQGELIPILISFGLWVLGYVCLVANDLSWRFTVYKVKQKNKERLYDLDVYSNPD
jgi:hypothetical protein